MLWRLELAGGYDKGMGPYRNLFDGLCLAGWMFGGAFAAWFFAPASAGSSWRLVGDQIRLASITFAGAFAGRALWKLYRKVKSRHPDW